MVWKKKWKKVLRKFKNKQSAGQVMLTAFHDYPGLEYAESGPDAHKEK